MIHSVQDRGLQPGACDSYGILLLLLWQASTEDKPQNETSGSGLPPWGPPQETQNAKFYFIKFEGKVCDMIFFLRTCNEI
jgi:hypothetical protein